MAIMQSCCCWRSVRRGSFACAIYTGLYFALTTVITTNFLDQERQYLAGNRSAPESASFLEPETISPATVRFNIVLLSCSCCGVLASILLLYGLFKDKRVLLIPWILTVITFSVIDIMHSMYVCLMNSQAYVNGEILTTPLGVGGDRFVHNGIGKEAHLRLWRDPELEINESCNAPFNPVTAMVFTLNFFVVCLNMYSLLCVISQYQEYLAGRGTAADDCEHRVPAVRYAVQPTTTATSCLSSRRAPTNNETRVTATPTQSPTAVPATLNVPDKSPVASKPGRKHVQFPDTPSANQGEKSETVAANTLQTWVPPGVELCKTPSQVIPAVVDTAPLLSSPTPRQADAVPHSEEENNTSNAQT